MTSTDIFDSAGKRAVRELWNTPLLRFLNQEYNFRYRYMGLPGVELRDLKLWRDMIDEVVAFEIPAPRTEVDPDGRRRIVTLRRNLKLLGIPSKAFFGPLEEVVILQRDYDGMKYEQKNVVTLYNFDFCDEISSRIRTRTKGQQVWRFEAFRSILRDQQDCYLRNGGPSYFIMLLTVRDQIDSPKLRDFLDSNLYEDTKAYLNACGGVGSLPTKGNLLGTHSWALKAFIHNLLRNYLVNPNISAAFFPVIKYRGTPVSTGNRRLLQSPMLHCMLFCSFGRFQSPLPAFLPENFLEGVSTVSVSNEGALEWSPQLGESQVTSEPPDPTNLFRSLNLGVAKIAGHQTSVPD